MQITTDTKNSTRQHNSFFLFQSQMILRLVKNSLTMTSKLISNISIIQSALQLTAQMKDNDDTIKNVLSPFIMQLLL